MSNEQGWHGGEIENRGLDMQTVLGRFLLLQALSFWQGGFMFYGAIVVPVGSEVLGSDQMQGWITRLVTNYLNLAGLVALLCWCVEIATTPDASRRRRRFRWALCSALLVMLGVLGWLHVRMDALLDVEGFRILDRGQFRLLHSVYLTTSTIQWAGCLALLVLTLAAWRAADQGEKGDGQ